MHRLGSRIRQHLAMVLQTKIRDPRLNGVVVHSAQVSPDLSVVQVYYAPPPGREQEKPDEIEPALRRAAGFMRSSLAAGLKIRRIPELRFVRDAGREQLDEIDRLLSDAGLRDGEGSAE